MVCDDVLSLGPTPEGVGFRSLRVNDLFGFVSDLRTDEAATVERARSETGGVGTD